jgi:hypothetical protein
VVFSKGVDRKKALENCGSFAPNVPQLPKPKEVARSARLHILSARYFGLAMFLSVAA